MAKKRLTQEEFIAKAKKVHGDRYNYDKVNYISSRIKVTITCPKHGGDFDQTPNSHLKKVGCRKCFYNKRKKTTEEFIIEARKIHGDFYNYDKVNYIGNDIDVTINCPNHGDFDQTPDNHINSKSGCKKCASDKQTKTTKEFIVDARKIHGDYYNYDKVNYINDNTKVTITCPGHGGDFNQTPSSHLKGNGCNTCAKNKRTRTTEEFILEAKKIHGDFYNYDKVNYINAHIKVKITCPIHGDFDQIPSVHLNQESGCDNCAKENSSSYLYGTNLHLITNLYLIKLESDSELFLKIGMSNDIQRRIKEIKSEGYNVKLLKLKKGIGFDIIEFEKNFLRHYSKFRYTPKSTFGGYTECLDISLLKELPNDNWYITD